MIFFSNRIIGKMDLSSDCWLLVLEKVDGDSLAFLNCVCQLGAFIVSATKRKVLCNSIASSISRFDLGYRLGATPATSKTLVKIAKKNNLSVLEYFMTKYGNVFKDNLVISYAIKHGNLDMLKYAYEQGFPWDKEIRIKALKVGNIPIIKYMKEIMGINWDGVSAFALFENLSIELLRYTRTRYTENDVYLTCQSAKNGDLETLRYLHETGCPWDARTCSWALVNGNLEVLKYLHENGCPWDNWTYCNAVDMGYMDCLKYLHENGCPWNEGVSCRAAEVGNLEMLKYLHENGCPWNAWTHHGAARRGSLECLKYAHENGCPNESRYQSDEETCSYAAEYGHLDCLKYLHENSFPWDSRTCTMAARNGHLEILKYAHENGCSWDSSVCHRAAEYEYLDILKYAYDNGCSYDIERLMTYARRTWKDPQLLWTIFSRDLLDNI
jgi:hypothetical protein